MPHIKKLYSLYFISIFISVYFFSCSLNRSGIQDTDTNANLDVDSDSDSDTDLDTDNYADINTDTNFDLDIDSENLCIDNDGDKHGINCPDGEDCDDNDPDNWISCDTCNDNDGDSYFIYCDLYKTVRGPDCDDAIYYCTKNCDVDDDNDGLKDCSEKTWLKTFNIDNNKNDTGNSVVSTSDNGIIISGSTKENFWILKLDETGAVQWQSIIAGNKTNILTSVIKTSNSDYITTGYTDSFGAGGNDIWLMRFTDNGESIWQKTFGGSDNDLATSIIETSDNGFVISGYTNKIFYYNVLLIKINSEGSILWQKTIGNLNGDVGYSVLTTSDNGLVIAGYAVPEDINDINNIGVIKLDKNGEIVWQKSIAGTNYDISVSIANTSDNGFIVAGYTNSFGAGSYDIWLIKLDNNGEIIWQKTFGGPTEDLLSSIIKTKDNNFVITGFTKIAGFNNYDVLVFKIDNDGQILWNKIIGGLNDDTGNSVTETTYGDLVLVGNTKSFQDIQNGEMIVIRLLSNGTFIGDCSNVLSIDLSSTDTNGIINDINLTSYSTEFGVIDYAEIPSVEEFSVSDICPSDL